VTDRDLTDVFIHTANPAWLLARGLFVTEGRHCTRRLLTSGRFKVVALLLTPTAEAALADVIDPIPSAERPPIIVKSQADLDALTKFRLHQGCVAYAERISPPAWQPGQTQGGLSVLLERVRDPDNVGSIARSASAMGVQALLMGPECADPFYRKAVRTSMGAVLTSTIVDASPWPGVLDALKAAGHTLIATTPDPAAVPIDRVAARLLEREGFSPRDIPGAKAPGFHRSVILLVGSEGEGLSPEALKAADIHARIPMTTMVDSLNVGVATAVAVYALGRRI
jgi:tRNA G18 (ribose-2'-O)-methylase SpoU